MAQSLENRFEIGRGSRLGYPNNPSQPIATSPSLANPNIATSTLHDLYSYDGNPSAATVERVRFTNFNGAKGNNALPQPTELQAFTGPQNTGAAAAGFRNYNNQSTYDDFILAQGGQDGALAANRFQGRGDSLLR